MEFAVSPPNQDPCFFDRKNLQTIADERTSRHGLRCFRDWRIIEVDQDREMLWAGVKDFCAGPA